MTCCVPLVLQARFIKLCRATGLVGRQLPSTEADLIFASVKDRSGRRISFEQARRRLRGRLLSSPPCGINTRPCMSSCARSGTASI